MISIALKIALIFLHVKSFEVYGQSYGEGDAPTTSPKWGDDVSPTKAPAKVSWDDTATPTYSPSFLPSMNVRTTDNPTSKATDENEIPSFSPSLAPTEAKNEKNTLAPAEPKQNDDVYETNYVLADGDVEVTIITNKAEGTITVDYTYFGQAWVAFGFSEEGLMIGSTAIVGFDVDSAPLKFDLTGKSLPGVVRASDDRQKGITNAEFQQNATHTRMMFTKPLDEPDELEILADGPNKFLYAFGSSNEFGIHQKRGSFDMEVNRVEGVSSPNLSSGATGGNEISILAVSLGLVFGVLFL